MGRGRGVGTQKSLGLGGYMVEIQFVHFLDRIEVARQIPSLMPKGFHGRCYNSSQGLFCGLKRFLILIEPVSYLRLSHLICLLLKFLEWAKYLR